MSSNEDRGAPKDEEQIAREIDERVSHLIERIESARLEINELAGELDVLQAGRAKMTDPPDHYEVVASEAIPEPPAARGRKRT